MRNKLIPTTTIGVFAIAIFALSQFAVVRLRATETTMTHINIQIPDSIRTEHNAIHSVLMEATQAPGQVGVAARELAKVLHPHFEREEQIALPPLGLLAPLAAGDKVSQETLSAILAMTDSLRAELPRMMEEHKSIRAAVEKLRIAARAAQLTKYEQLAEELALHAQTEEEVLYPSAVLVGDVIRMRK